MNNNRTWEALSMKDRASFIKLAVQNGYRDIGSIRNLYNDSNKFDSGGPTNDYNAVLYNGEITVPIEEIPIIGKSGLTEYKPGDKRYIDQIRKFTDRIYSGDLAIDAVPEYYRKGVQNTLIGDQFANKVIKSRDEDYRVLRNAMTAIPLAVGAQAVLPAIPVDKIIKVADKVSDLYTKWVPKSVRRGVKSAWEGFSLYDTIDNLDDRIETANNAFQDGKIGKGIFNTSLTLLDLAGIGSSINDVKKLGKKFVEKLPEFNGIDLEHPSVPAFIRNSNKAPIINYKVNTFLNSPSKITTYFLNKKFPQKQREEVWQRVVDYNNMQRRRGGLDDMSIPYNENVIKAANRLDEIKNIFGKIDVNGDLGKVLAHSKGKITDADYDVRFFLPSLFQKDKYFSPRAIGAHEVRHGIQHTFGTKNVGFGRAEQKVLSDLNDYDLEYGLSFSDLLGGSSTKREQKILENSKYRKNRINWVKSLPEFDAEMSTFREVYQLDDSYNKWDSKHRYLFNKWASERFGISYEEAMDIAEGLSTKGYALGGPLYNEDNPIESFQGNPYIPVVRYDDGGRIKNNHSYLTWHSNDRIGKAKDYVKNYLSSKKAQAGSNLNDNILTDSFNKIDELTFYDSLIKDSSALASYNPKEHSVTVFDYNTNNDTSLEHEIAHSTNKYWPNYKNGETAPKYYDYYKDILSNTDTHPILNQINRTLSDNKYIDLYWDRPTEVYSRLLELKKYLKASPNKMFSKEDIEHLKNSDLGKVNIDPYAIISRYDTDTLYDLLNKN